MFLQKKKHISLFVGLIKEFTQNSDVTAIVS